MLKQVIDFFQIVTAITCYECVPEPPDNWCQFTSNVTDCDEKSKTDGAEYDACAKTSLEVLYEGDNHLMNIMSCTTKVCKNFTRQEGGLESMKNRKTTQKRKTTAIDSDKNLTRNRIQNPQNRGF